MSDLGFGHFQTAKFLLEVDQVRRQRDVTCRRFFEETGIQVSNIKAKLRKKDATISAHTMAALAVWSGISPLTYMELRKVGE